MPQQKKWNEYEVALLIEVYIKVTTQGAELKSELEDLSVSLRNMAILAGEQIDNTYRNLNGMQWQYAFIKEAFEKTTFDSREPSTLFMQMVNLYKNDRTSFERILDVANSKAGKVKTQMTMEDNRQQFKEWLKNGAAKKLTPDVCCECLLRTSEYACSHGVSKVDFWQITDYKRFNQIRNSIQGNRIYRLSHPFDSRTFDRVGKLYSDFLKEKYENQPTTTVAAEPVKVSEDKPSESQKFVVEQDVSQKAIEEPSSIVKEENTTGSSEKVLVVDFSQRGDFTYTKPIRIILFGERIDDFINWRHAYVAVFKKLYERCPAKIHSLLADNGLTGNIIPCSANPSDLRNPLTVNENFYIEGNLSAGDIVFKIGSLLRFCGIDYSDVVIEYIKKSNANSENIPILPSEAQINAQPIVVDGIDMDFTTWLVRVKGLAENTSRMYTSSVKFVNDYAMQKSFVVGSLYETPVDELEAVANRILTDEWFSAYNIEKHNRFSAALQAFLQYRTGKITVEVKSRKRNISSYDNSPILSSFISWLTEVKRLADNTARNYASSMNSVSVYALENNIIETDLLELDGIDLQTAVSAILQNEKFAQYNAQQHNRFSAALQAFLQYRLDDDTVSFDVRPRKRHIVSTEETIQCPNDLRVLLEEKFRFGIRLDSAIDLIKLKSFAEATEVPIPDDEELLKKQILAGGLFYEGKVYFFPEEVYQGLIDEINAIFDEGYSVIYYEVFYDKHFEWLDENRISSYEMLPELLRGKLDGVYLGKNCLLKGDRRVNELDAIEQEIANFWGDGAVHTYDEMYKKLPYIPEDKVRFYLSRSDRFVWSAYETFAFVDRLIITEAERQAIYDYVNDKCNAVGYASLSDIPLGSIEEENYEFSSTAIYDAVYNLVLKNDFTRNGKILNKNNSNSNIDIVSLARVYCSAKEGCSFTELYDYVKETNGTSNRRAAYAAAYDTMVRVAENKFVADRFVNFDIEAVDKLLEQYIEGDFISVKEIATFALFPNCNYPWNHFVLESFCYKYSNKFSLRLMHFNEKNVGIIVKKGVTLDYKEMVAIAAAKSGLKLKEDIIGKYLVDVGYLAKSKMAGMQDILDRAKQIREGA